MKSSTLSLILFALLTYFAVTMGVEAVVPPPDGGYPNFTTAEGDNALKALTSGVGNTAIGTFSLFSVTTGNFNTAVGAGALDLNTAGNNTAIGAAALLFNTSGTQNTAIGTAALEFNESGNFNAANGAFALFSNTIGFNNSATGYQALFRNTDGIFNTATGAFALMNNVGGADNTADGYNALQNTTGSDNTAIGYFAGANQTTGSGNVYIGQGVVGIAGESNACYIKSIFGQTSADGIPVLINSDNKLGTATSSMRYKQDIMPMDKASAGILALKPVTFHYKKELDPRGISQFGLVAEEVEKVNPDLIVRDKEGKPYSVRYDQVNAMLLNEFLKEHKKIEEQQVTIAELKSASARQEAINAQQQKGIEALAATVKKQAAQIQKVSAQLELNKAAPQMVLHNQ